MSDDKGDPRSSRHLRPANMPRETGVMPVDPNPPVISQEEVDEMNADLRKLQEPFEVTEKLPKPMWKGAWDGESKGHCNECGGYHCLTNTIHLDYVGHAEVTKRLLEVDPLWDWEPLAFESNGLPQFDKFGGLWIKLTVCGVTRLGYGDATGKAASSTAVKEIIGDAIRNAAMRFGVALDLWSKLDRHESKNPGATEAPAPQQNVDRGQKGGGRGGDGAGSRRRSGNGSERKPSKPSPEVEDALAVVTSICDAHGYSYEYANDRFESDFGIKPVEATADQLLDFGQQLIAEANPEPDDGGAGAVPGTGGDGESDQPAAPVDPTDTSDVEKKPGDLF